jgi:hypothetical protein
MNRQSSKPDEPPIVPPDRILSKNSNVASRLHILLTCNHTVFSKEFCEVSTSFLAMFPSEELQYISFHQACGS